MAVYWGFLILSLFVEIWFQRAHHIVYRGMYPEKKAPILLGIIFFAVVCFFCGMRSGVADTGTYIAIFRDLPSDWETGLQVLSDGKDKGFYLLAVLYKSFISEDFHGWLFLIALISSIATFVGFYKYSSEFGLSCFLFIATTTFTYLINGMRQYIVIAMVLAFSEWIVQKKYIRFCLLILLLYTVHASALIFIPLIFLVNSKPWSIQMWLTVAVAIFLGLNVSSFMTVLSTTLEETQYENYIDYIANSGVGSNVIRLVLAALPVVLAFMENRIIQREGTPIIRLCVNMSVINFCVYFIATFTSGMALGRVAAYFDIYNLILLPWLVMHFPERTLRATMRTGMLVCYTIYFWFQMTVAWSITYESDILGLFI